MKTMARILVCGTGLNASYDYSNLFGRLNWGGEAEAEFRKYSVGNGVCNYRHVFAIYYEDEMCIRDSPNDRHRHISHLWGLYPGYQISPYRSPVLFEAAKNTLIQRGDPSTGWSMGWKVCFWARMLDGDHAYQSVSYTHLMDDTFVAMFTRTVRAGGIS